MFIEQISGQNIKIKFDINEKQLLLGDILKITASGKNGVLVQVISISTDEKNSNFNIAESKILFTIETSGRLTKWQGNIPSQEFIISKLSAKEVLLCSNTSSPQNPLPVGVLSLYPDTSVELESTFFEKPTVIFCDKQAQKENILSLLSCELSKTAGSTVLIDFNNNYSDLKVALNLQAGTNIKLPFDLKSLEFLYNKIVSDVSPETRAVVEDIFMEIENYLSSEEVEFIPFISFRRAIDSVYEAHKLTELVLLRNKLIKLDKQGVFADKKAEIASLAENVRNNNLVIIDLSKFPHEWQKDFVEYIVDSNTQKYKQKFFLLVDIDKINVDKTFIEKLCTIANKNGVCPIIVSGHESENAISLLSYSANIIAFAPENTTKLVALKDNIVRLRDNEAVITGKITNNVPLFVDIYQDEDIQETHSIENSAISSPEIYLSYESETETETQEGNISGIEVHDSYHSDEMQEEAADEKDSFNYSNQFEHDKTGIELVENISMLQEEVYPSIQEDDEGSPAEEEHYESYSESDEYAGDEEEQNYEEEEYDFNLEEDDQVQNINSNSAGFYDEEDAAYSVSEEEALEYGSYNNLDDSYYDEEDTEEEYESSAEPEESEANTYNAGSGNSFYDEYDSSYNYDSSKKYDSGFSEDDLASFVDDDVEYNTGSYLVNNEESGDENFDYSSNEEFQDESVLDYSDFYDEEQDEQPQSNLNNEYDYQENNYSEEYDDNYDESMEDEEPVASQVKSRPVGPPMPDIPIYATPSEEAGDVSSSVDFQEGDKVRHSKYGLGTVTKIIGSSEKRLCSIQFEDVGRRLLDPKLAELEKIS